MDQITEIKLFDGEPGDDVFAPNPDDYEQHTLIGNCIRGNAGDTVQVHKNDLAILRANKLIASEDGEAAPEQKPLSKAAQAKAEKAEAAAQAKAEAAELPAIPNLADLPGV